MQRYQKLLTAKGLVNSKESALDNPNYNPLVLPEKNLSYATKARDKNKIKNPTSKTLDKRLDRKPFGMCKIANTYKTNVECLKLF